MIKKYLRVFTGAHRGICLSFYILDVALAVVYYCILLYVYQLDTGVLERKSTDREYWSEKRPGNDCHCCEGNNRVQGSPCSAPPASCRPQFPRLITLTRDRNEESFHASVLQKESTCRRALRQR